MPKYRRGLGLLAAVLALGAGVASAQTDAVGVGSPALNPNGSARLPVTIPSAGTLTIRDIYVGPGRACSPPKRIKTLTTPVAQPGLVELQVIPVGRARKKLAAGRKVKLVAQVGFTPAGGEETIQNVAIKLHRGTQGTVPQAARAHAACTTPRSSH